MPGLIEFTIDGFRGIVHLHAEPNGKSVTLRGKNGAGKSSGIDALWWGLGGQIDGPVINNKSKLARTEIIYDIYHITRHQEREGGARLTVRPVEGGAALKQPTTILAGLREAIERRTFSTRKPAEQADILRRLAPELDTKKLDAEYEMLFAERTAVNRDAKALDAQAAGVTVPDAPANVPDDMDIAEIASKKADAERKRSANAETRRLHQGNVSAVKSCLEDVAKLEKQLAEARESLEQAENRLRTSTERVSLLKDCDTSAIDEEIRLAKIHNAARAAQRRQVEAAKLATEQRERLLGQAKEKHVVSDKLTIRLGKIIATKKEQLAKAKLPIAGLSVDGDSVTLAQDDTGPVEISALNTAAQIRLDVCVAAALGSRLIAARNASLLDDDDMAKVDAFARERGVQLLKEVVSTGQPLTAEIVEAPTLEDIAAGNGHGR